MIGLVRTALAIGIALGLGASVAHAAPCVDPDNETRVTGGDECLVIKTFRSSERPLAPVLLIIIHGDVSAGGPAVYHFRQAKQLAQAGRPDVVAVALIRPGYYDDDGNTSTGTNFGRRDSYTNENIDAISRAIATLKASYGARKVILVGHSGGAAISGVILGRHPRLADAAVLVACPCDIDAWRAGKSSWGLSQSPDKYIDMVPFETRVTAIVGSDDNNTWPGLSIKYVETLVAHGSFANLVVVPGANHNDSFRSSIVIDTALSLSGR